MLVMRKYRGLRSPTLLAAVLLALALNSACSRRVALNGGPANGQSDSRDLPFHGDAQGLADPASHPGIPDQRDSSRTVPFKSSASAVLPAGTLLTVRLINTLTTAMPDANKSFLAVVEEPVVIDGRTIIPIDAEVKGRVESSRITIVKRRTGYLRLTLDSIRLGDKEIALPTSSLFARGNIVAAGDDSTAATRTLPVADRPPQIIRLKKGRSLTFRLTAAVNLSTPAEDKSQSGTK